MSRASRPQSHADAPREYRIVQNVPLLGLRVGDIVLYENGRYSLCRGITADPLLLRAALGEASLFIEAPAEPTAAPTRVIPFPTKGKARGTGRAKRARKAAK